MQQQQLDAVAREPAGQLVAVEPAERHRRHLDLEAAAMRQEAVDEYLAGIAQADAVGSLVEAR